MSKENDITSLAKYASFIMKVPVHLKKDFQWAVFKFNRNLSDINNTILVKFLLVAGNFWITEITYPDNNQATVIKFLEEFCEKNNGLFQQEH